MPVTNTWIPVLSQFLCAVENTTGEDTVGMSAPTTQSKSIETVDRTPKKPPKGVILDKDGKPCRTCTSSAAWKQMMRAQNPASSFATAPTAAATTTTTAVPVDTPTECPADVEVLGRSTWTMLHTLTATYPTRPSMEEQQQTKRFISLFSNLYPCSHCAADFRSWMSQDGNEPKVSNRDEFGRWMCEAHNAVNEKLGKSRFDCSKWEERWRTGPPDGRCD